MKSNDQTQVHDLSEMNSRGFDSGWEYRHRLNDYMETVRLKKGVPIYSHSEIVEEFYFIQEGLVGLYRYIQPNKRILLHKFFPSETVGLTELHLKDSFPGHLLPIKESVALVGTTENLERLKQEEPDLVDKLILHESQSHSRTYDKVVKVLSGNVDERIARELLELAEEIGRDTNQGSQIVIGLSRKDISRMVGCSKETASRVMSDWEQEGTIDTNNKQITISNPDELHSLVTR